MYMHALVSIKYLHVYLYNVCMVFWILLFWSELEKIGRGEEEEEEEVFEEDQIYLNKKTIK